MRAKKKVQRNLVRDFRRYKDRIAGILGDYSGTVEVPNRSGYVFVRLANQEVKEAFNKKVPNLVDLPVWVGYSDDPREQHILQVLDTRTGVERQKGEDPISQFLPLHHQTHEWFNPNGGQDVVFSDKRQFMPFRPTPAGGMFVHVYRNVGWLNGQFTYFSGSSIDLSPYVPETGAYLGLLYEDINATLAFSTGTGDFLKDGLSLTLADIPNPLPGTYPIAAVRMWGGQTGIVEARDRTDLIDLRFPFTYGFNHLYDAPHSYTGSGGLGVFVKADETGLEFATAGAGGGGQSSAITLFMTEDVGYVTGTFNLDTTVGNKEDREISSLNVSGTSFGSWISQEGALSFVNSGQYLIHFHAFRDSASTPTCGLYDARIGVRVNKRNSNGSHTLIQTLYQEKTSPNPPFVTAYYTSPFGETGYTLTGTFSSALSFADDEGILLEFFVDPVQTDPCTGAGCGGECDDPRITLYLEGNTDTGITLPITTSGGPGHVIQDEGADLAQQNRLNFVGGGVEAVNDPANGRTTVRIPGTVSVFDDGVFQVSGTALDFMDNLDVAVTGSHVFVSSSGSGHTIQDEGISLTQRTNLNFVGAGVTVTDDAGNDASVVTIPSQGTSKTLQTHTVLHQETLVGTGRFDVSSISQDYDHLIVRLISRSTVAAAADAARLFFNNDTTLTNYRRSYILQNDGATAVGADDNPAFITSAANSTADDFGIAEIYIPLYAGAKRKTVSIVYSTRKDATLSQNGQTMINWENTAAINQITIQPDGYATDEFAAGSYLEIIGVREEAVGGAAYSTGTFSNPPTDAELDAEFGTPGTVGGGFLAAINNGGLGTDHYFVWASGDNWLYLTGTVAM